MGKAKRGRKRKTARGGLERLRASVSNAKEIIEFGRLGTPWGTPYEIVHHARHHRLRRYANADTLEVGTQRSSTLAPVLLVPPLMLTSEIYDVAADVSAVAALTRAGLDVWLVDYGAPEREEGGLERTLDDHVLAVDDCIDRIRAATGSDVHLVGYSQGGMFCYQTAAYRRCEGIASLITFGSPVDIHRNLPALDAELGSRLIGAARRAVTKPLAQIEGLPGFLTSTGFKALSLRKELQQISDFLAKLHDREALVKRESRRRFLAGEGFVAWPGPALRTFVDEFIVANRMSAGGFVVAGRTATLAELDTPILYFYGDRDDIARPASVQAIAKAAPLSESYGLPLPAGHFGLVVGTTAMSQTWPTVIEWVRWRAGAGPRPSALPDPEAERARVERMREEWDEVESFDIEADFEPVGNMIGDLVGTLGRTVLDRVSEGSRELGETVDDLRYQLPRLRTLEQLQPDTRISLGLELSERAARSPKRTFFLWRGRAFSYAEAERRVDAIVRGLIDRGLRPGDRVGVLMSARPSYLSLVAAINRMGAVAVLYKPTNEGESLARAVAKGPLAALVADPQNAELARVAWQTCEGPGPVLVLGGGPQRDPAQPLPEGVFDMEGIDPDAVELPAWYVPNPGRARDLALVIVTVRPWSPAREARISNARWAVSAYGAAATCLLSSKDTVLCALPLHHPAGMLVTVGGALVGRSRLALGSDFDPQTFWTEVRRYGATVSFYAGEMWRALLDAPPSPAEGNHSLRLIAGSGMRADAWRRVQERFGPLSIREFYASTEGNLVLANISGKPGALGRPLPGSNELAVVAYDFEADDFFRDGAGLARRCRPGEAGLLIAKVDETHPRAAEAARDEPQSGAPSPRAETFRKGVFSRHDLWFVTGDIVRRDSEGDIWYVDRGNHLIAGPHGWVSSREIEDALYAVAGVSLAVVHGRRREDLPPALGELLVASGGSGGERVLAALVVGEGFERSALNRLVAELRPEQRPALVMVRDAVALTDGFRPLKTPLRQAAVDPEDPRALRWTPERGYQPLVAPD
ncbi:alpha/beta fold hydrolase [Pseudenhygromyxa sp. WMMC2535]|uniref:alpha/beta fold hydrolase n=1 Tax=Pseudenhygromyxa sp. WMMC2535 TaxID=2712867 RepID=UPI0015524BAD|nr:alpha/beta fold hydrolase [Pseudenhygromyxa sp. WMMC2535]